MALDPVIRGCCVSGHGWNWPIHGGSRLLCPPPHIMSSSWSETRWQLTGPKDKILYLTERVVEEEGRGKPHSWKIVVMLKCQKLRYFNYLAYPVCAQEARGWVMVIIVTITTIIILSDIIHLLSSLVGHNRNWELLIKTPHCVPPFLWGLFAPSPPDFFGRKLQHKRDVSHTGAVLMISMGKSDLI